MPFAGSARVVGQIGIGIAHSRRFVDSECAMLPSPIFIENRIQKNTRVTVFRYCAMLRTRCWVMQYNEKPVAELLHC